MILRLAVLIMLGCQMFWQCLPAFAFDQAHSLFTAELKKYVDDSGVHYGNWQQHQQGLMNYIAELEKITPEEYASFTPQQKKALWINAYNALAIKVVLGHYPIHGDRSYFPPNSMRQIPNCWEDFHVKIAGRELDLYTIAHNVIRKECADPRMHFAIVCAAKSCPKLPNHAYVADNLEQVLDDAAREYVNNGKNVQFDPEKNELKVSLLFSWFPLDFALQAFNKISVPPPEDEEIIEAYIEKYLSAEHQAQLKGQQWKVVYLPYDWSLNDADAQVARK